MAGGRNGVGRVIGSGVAPKEALDLSTHDQISVAGLEKYLALRSGPQGRVSKVATRTVPVAMLRDACCARSSA
jgi:hypothetical protein